MYLYRILLQLDLKDFHLVTLGNPWLLIIFIRNKAHFT
jgi:hypothetical protein